MAKGKGKTRAVTIHMNSGSPYKRLVVFPSVLSFDQNSSNFQYGNYRYIYTWGKGYCGALGQGDEIDKTTPELLNKLKSHLAVCARKRKTFVLGDNDSVYGCGWMGFGSLGFPDRGVSDKILSPRILDSFKSSSLEA
ncbi:ultraviolet-B receptor UVR8 isoform X2 [Prunus yedoensis var. nudiflora]|uniref:Ultraviolet-B receptor UVR8 isoform X2 n=1 Tax=Prunus yedoensis var. nudiflora TaxID=2094558 RepID=A0A314YZI0_PRUYE|nr:ultraviolet-B receptor UVR8 isoform X2 [Prunus yedoensis var. nudiflora]